MKEPAPYFIRPVSSRLADAREPEYSVLDNGGDAQVDLRQYWMIIRKRFGFVVAVPLVLVLLVALRDFMVTPLYTAQATIVIKNSVPQLSQETSVDASSASYSPSTSPSDVSYKTEYQLLRSRSLAAMVIANMGLSDNPLFARAARAAAPEHVADDITEHPRMGDSADHQVPPELIAQYLRDLRVAPIDGTELVNVSFSSPSPELSARVTNTHVQEFIHQGIELNAQAGDEAERFLQSKLDTLKRQVEQSELALNNYRRDKGIIPGLISVNGSQDVVLDRLNKLSEQVQQAHLHNVDLGTTIALIDQGHEDALPAVIDSKIVQELKGRLDQLQTQYVAMSGQYKPDYQPMVELTAKLKGTREALKREVASIVASIRAQYAASLKDEETLAQELKQEKDFALGLNDAAVKYIMLRREADTTRELYDAVLRRMKDVEVTADLHASNVSIVDKATPPRVPSSPRTVRDLLAAALLGLMGGLGLAFLLEHHDDSFQGEDEIESYLRVPALGLIPNSLRFRRAMYDVTKIGVSDGRLQQPDVGSGALSPGYGIHSPAAEAYRMLRTAILLSRAGTPPKLVLMTSALAAEGKTTTAANLAIGFASLGKMVVLVDADLRRPRCHELFGLDNRTGLTEALTGLRELDKLIQPTGFANLFLLSAGEMPPNPSELLGSVRMEEILARLTERYDCILIDSPPVLPVTDAVILSNMVDGVVLVANKETAKQQVKAALSRLERAHAKIFGVALNKVDFNSFGYYNRYYTYDYHARKPDLSSSGDNQGAQIAM